MFKAAIKTTQASLVIGLLCAGLIEPGEAANWYVRPDLRAGTEYNDNYRLNIDDANKLDGWGVLADLSVEAGTKTPKHEFFIQPRVQTGAYEDDDIDNLRDGDYYVNSLYRYNGRKSQLTFRPRWSSVSVLRSELADVDTEDFVTPDDTNGDSGIAVIDGTRDRWEMPIAYEYSFTPVQSFLAGLEYKDVSYDQNLSLLRDFTDTRGYIGYAQRVTERDWVTVTGSVGRYEPDTDLNSDIFEVTAEWERRFDELWKTYLIAGMNLTRFDVRVGNDIADDYDSRPLLKFGLVRVMERSQIRLEIGNDVIGTSEGELRDRLSARFVYERDFSRRWSFIGSLLAYQDTSLFSSNSTNLTDRTYLRARAGIGYALSPSLTLGGEYVFTFQDRDGLPDTAESNGLLLQILYRPERPRYR